MDFSDYICGVTHLPCCGCSLFCEHRQKTARKKEEPKEEKQSDNYVCRVTHLPCCGCSLFCEHRDVKTSVSEREGNRHEYIGI